MITFFFVFFHPSIYFNARLDSDRSQIFHELVENSQNRPSVEQILVYGKVVRPFMGVQLAPDMSVNQLGITGVLILDTKPGGPAWNAGVKVSVHVHTCIHLCSSFSVK